MSDAKEELDQIQDNFSTEAQKLVDECKCDCCSKTLNEIAHLTVHVLEEYKNAMQHYLDEP